MSYAEQMRVAAAEIKLRLDYLDSNWVRFAWLGATAFESATAVLFSAVVNGGQPSNQFIAHGCYLKTSLEMIKAFENTKEIWESWPLKLTRFGQYHFSGQSALNLAIKFANGMGTEVALARLKAYPGQAIEGRELGELTEWQTQFRWELNERRSELAEMPNWALHQERDTVLDGIKNELVVALENAGDKQRAEAVARLSKRDSTERESENKTSWNKLSNCEQVRLTKNRIFGFFRRWERKPNESDLSEFNSYFECGLAAPLFDQEFDDLLWLVWQVLNIAKAKQLPIQSTNRFHEMLCRYDIQAACTLKYDVSAELSVLLSSLSIELGGDDKNDIEAAVSTMEKRIQLAYLAAQNAEQRCGKILTDRESFEWIKENDMDGYSLPVFDTYTDYLTKARKHTGEQRKTPRGGRKNRSIVKQSEL